MSDRLRDAQGQIIVFWVIFLPVMLLFFFFVLEFGQVRAWSAEMQTFADAAALAGTTAGGEVEIDIDSGSGTITDCQPTVVPSLARDAARETYELNYDQWHVPDTVGEQIQHDPVTDVTVDVIPWQGRVRVTATVIFDLPVLSSLRQSFNESVVNIERTFVAQSTVDVGAEGKQQCPGDEGGEASNERLST